VSLFHQKHVRLEIFVEICKFLALEPISMSRTYHALWKDVMFFARNIGGATWLSVSIFARQRISCFEGKDGKYANSISGMCWKVKLLNYLFQGIYSWPPSFQLPKPTYQKRIKLGKLAKYFSVYNKQPSL